MENSKIQWTDNSWNIAVGCEKVSPGCKYCYMMRDYSGRFGRSDVNGLATRTKPATFNKPLLWQARGDKCANGKSLRVFTSSLTDVFIDQIDPYRGDMWDIIQATPDLNYQILTKRIERVANNVPDGFHEDPWRNVWIGTSVEDQQRANERIPLLVDSPGYIKFLSIEPLIGPVRLNQMSDGWFPSYRDPDNQSCAPMSEPLLLGIDWVIIGGESGNEKGKYQYRPCQLEWIYQIVEDCRIIGVPVFIKQMGTYLSKQMGLKDRHGGNIGEFPDDLKIREFPKKWQ